MPKPQKKKRVRRAELEKIELHPDAWKRFEEGLKQVTKARPIARRQKNKRISSS